MSLRRRISRYLRRSGMSASRFGRETINDSRLISDLNNGRKLRGKTAVRIAAWLDARDSAGSRRRRRRSSWRRWLVGSD